MATDSETNWLLIGKLAPPVQRVTAVRRGQLISRLDAGLERPVTLLVSPPGFGKTTLLTQWFHLLRSAADVAAGWLTLDETDAEASRFVAGLILAVSRAGVDVGSLEIAARQQNVDASVEPILAALLAAIRRAARRVVVILDDYHRAAGPATDHVVEAIIEHGQGDLHLVVSGRQRPTFHVSALTARGLVSSFVASDLVMTQQQASEVLGPEVTLADIEMLHSRTEGWPVALQLARLWLERGGRKPDALAEFSGRTEEMSAYLVEEIVQDLPEPLRELLLETCLLERFNAELANATRGRLDSGELLERLADLDALLVPLDGTRDWFRYHPLFADFLKQRLKRASGTRVNELHRRAAHWLAEAGDLLEAVRHALLAGDKALAIALTQAAGGWELILWHGVGYVRTLLAQFALPDIRDDPVLLLTQAYLDLKSGRHDQARELLARTERLLPRANARVQRDFAVIDALHHGPRDDLADPAWLAGIESRVEAMTSDDHLGRGTLLSVVAGAAMTNGNPLLSERASRAAIDEMRAARSVLGTNYLFLHLAQSHLLQGKLREGEGLFREALILAEENFGADSGLKALGEVSLAQCLYLRNDLSGSAALIESCLRTVEAVDGWVDVYAIAYDLAARLAFATGGLEAAMAVVSRAARTARERRIARLDAIVAAWPVEYLSLAGHVKEARAKARTSGLGAHAEVRGKPGIQWRVRLGSTLALARVAIATGNARYALKLLDAASADFRDARLLLPMHRLDALSVLALKQLRQEPEAVKRVEQLLDYTLLEGASRVLLEQGSALESVLHAAQRRNRELVLSAARRDLTTQLLAGLQPERSSEDEGFSARELEVLRELCHGRSNKAIGQLLDLSENTVKFHLKNLFRKLRVESRAQATAASIERGLVKAPSRPSPPVRSSS